VTWRGTDDDQLRQQAHVRAVRENITYSVALARERSRRHVEARILRLRTDAASLLGQADRLQRILDGKERP